MQNLHKIISSVLVCLVIKECLGQDDNEKKTVLLTGGAGFIGHHVIEVGIYNWFTFIITLQLCPGSTEQNRLGHHLSRQA